MLGYQTTAANVAGAPYQVVLAADSSNANTLGANSFLHPKSFAESKENRQHWFYYFVTKVTSLLGITAVVLAIVWTSIALFDDKPVRTVYETTTFLTSTDKTNSDAWQVMTQSVNDLSKLNPAVDTQFSHYFECWWRSGMLQTQCNNNSVLDYKACVQANYATQLATCVNTSDPNYLAPTLNYYAQCINNVFQPNRQVFNAFKICLRTNMWPLYESPEPVDSWYLLGSYNWMVLLTIGFALFSCFALYTGGFVMTADAMDVRKPGVPGKNGPLSYSVTGACAVAALVFFIYFLIISYKLPNSTVTGSKYAFPNSVATTMVMIPATLIVTVYFIAELVSMASPGAFRNMISKSSTGQQIMGTVMMIMNGNTVQVVQQPENVKLLQAGNNMPHRRGAFDGPYNDEYGEKTWKESVTAYFPALTLSWADAYMLDPVIAIGLIGATQQLHTALVYQIFIAIFAYRLAHTAVARFMYEGYIYNPDEADGKFDRSRDTHARDELYAVRMQAMFMHLAAVTCVIVLFYILNNNNLMISEYMLITFMLYIWYVVPEILRFISHVIVAFEAVGKADKDVLMTTNYCLWIWDVLARIIFIIIVFWGSDQIPATQYFLQTRLSNVTTTIAYFNS